jgi:Fe-S oxidoreductase
MASYKAEFLSHYWEGRIRPRSAYAFGLVDKWAQVASRAPGLVNLATSMPGIRELAKLAAGMPLERKIPQFAPQPFTRWMERRQGVATGQNVILFPDTFNNYFFPRTAKAAVNVLEHLGFHVEVPRQYICCGRPLYDYGFLDMAKQYLLRVLEVLRPALEAGTPIIVLEPSCWSVLRDEINELLPERPEAHRLMENTFLLGEFLDKKVDGEKLPRLYMKAVLHGHCHHKAIIKKAEEEVTVLKHMGMDVQELNSGCCGMAGSFGFEADKYDVSVAVGEHTLLPAVRKTGLSNVIVADGFSCREQISQLTNRHALHLAEVMQLAIENGHAGTGGILPEQRFVREHEAAIRQSKTRTSWLLGGIAAAAGLALWLAKRR